MVESWSDVLACGDTSKVTVRVKIPKNMAKKVSFIAKSRGFGCVGHAIRRAIEEYIKKYRPEANNPRNW